MTDDVELLARAAVGRVEPPPPVQPAEVVDGWILSGACRWYAFRVAALDDSAERTRIVCDFFGLNRGKHAVVEAAILATRIEFLPAEEILAQFEHLRTLVDKTGGTAERQAFDFLFEFVRSRCSGDPR